MLKKNYTKIDGLLHIGGLSVEYLRKKYGTPLYIYDQKLIKDTARAFRENFKSDIFASEVSFASKAGSNLYLLGLIKNEDLFLDTVSIGEMYIAMKAGFEPKKIHLHGNNKTKEELVFAIENKIGTIIIDSYEEFLFLEEILKEMDEKMDCLLRINPDVKTSTHKYIQTSNADSKFGINIRDEKIGTYIMEMAQSQFVNLLGFHAHIGSQVMEVGFFEEEAKILFDFTKKMQDLTGQSFSHLNLGGGFGVRQNKNDKDFDLEKFLRDFAKIIEEKIKEYDLEITSIGIEPGRSMINQAGTTIYSVGSVKHTLEGLPLVFVDGGMSDNIRPSLYGAKYDALIANRLDDKNYEKFRVGGKLCESGDILIEETDLPYPKRGDILAIENTGAYSLAMTSNYNKLPKPTVVFVEDGKDYLAVKRETLEDLIKKDLRYKGE